MPYPEGSSFADQHAALVKAMTEYVAKVNYGPQKFFATQSEAARTAEDFAFHSLKPLSVVQLHYRWWAQTEPLTLDYLHRTGISKPVDDKQPGFRLYAKLLQGQALADILPEVQASDKEHVSAWGSLMETRMGTPIPKDVAQFLVDDGFFNRRNSPVPDLANPVTPSSTCLLQEASIFQIGRNLSTISERRDDEARSLKTSSSRWCSAIKAMPQREKDIVYEEIEDFFPLGLPPEETKERLEHGIRFGRHCSTRHSSLPVRHQVSAGLFWVKRQRQSPCSTLPFSSR